MNHTGIIAFIIFSIAKIEIFASGGTQLYNSYPPDPTLIAKMDQHCQNDTTY